jgi:hypothetical protein
MTKGQIFFLALCLGVRSAWTAEGDQPPKPDLTNIQPAPLAGLWSLSLGGDFSSLGGQDLGTFYASGAPAEPAARLSPGFFLLGRKHVSDGFYACAGLSSLSKNYSVDRPGGQDLFEWDSLLMSTGGGWLLSRSLGFALFTQAEVGWFYLSQGTFERTGPAATQGLFQGSALATQFSAGGLFFLLPSVALDLDGGYRFARLPLTYSGNAGDPGFKPDFYADFSGPYARAGLNFFWGLRNPWGPGEAPPPRQGPPGSE